MAESQSVGAIDDIDVEQLRRIFWLLKNKLPLVFEANRFFEEQTGLHNEAGANNLVDALSHLATIVERAEQLGPGGQREQVGHLEDHLRRSMMEGFEQVAKQQIGDIADAWRRYVALAGDIPADPTGSPAVISQQEMEESRESIRNLLNQGRSSKRDVDWEVWEDGTNALAHACEISGALMRRLQTAIAVLEAEQDRRRFTLALTASTAVLAALVGVLLGILIS